jgi:hypothetical protein
VRGGVDADFDQQHRERTAKDAASYLRRYCGRVESGGLDSFATPCYVGGTGRGRDAGRTAGERKSIHRVRYWDQITGEGEQWPSGEEKFGSWRRG